MKSLFVKSYKNIEDLTIDSLADVNLIVGCNNVGKSTLLEAISIYAANGDISWLKKILEYRGEAVGYRSGEENAIEKEQDRFSSLFPNREVSFTENKCITVGSKDMKSDKNNSVSIRFVHFLDEVIADEKGNERRNRIILKSDDHADFSSIIGVGLEISGSNNKYLYPLNGLRPGIAIANEKGLSFEFVKTNDFRNNQNALLWDKVSLSKEEEYVIRALKIIEPRIEKLNFLKDDVDLRYKTSNEERIPFVVLTDSDYRYRLSSMGDGLNRLLTIILALVNCKNGMFLLDEFENGLHYSVQTDLWKIIFMLSKELHIQVFVTTHSNDCIRSFVEASSDGNGKLIRLENRNGKVVEVSYDDENLEFAIDQNIEIR